MPISGTTSTQPYTAQTTMSNGTTFVFVPSFTTVFTSMNYCSPQQRVTIFSPLPATQPAYTSTIGPDSQTVVIGVPSGSSITFFGSVVTSTVALPATASGYTSTFTSDSLVIVGVPSTAIVNPQSIVTTTITSGNIATTTTILPVDTTPGTVEVIVPNPPLTTTITSGGISQTITIPASDTTPPIVEIIEPSSTITTTITSGSTAQTIVIPGSNTAPPVVEVIQPDPSTCRIPGFNYAFYRNPFTRSDTSVPYDSFDPAYFETQPAESTGNFTGPVPFSVSVPSYATIWGQPNVYTSYFAAYVTLYIYSEVAQTVNITSSGREVFYMYIGDHAYSGFNSTNWNYYGLAGQVGSPGIHQGTPIAVDVPAGYSLPYRLVYGGGYLDDKSGIARISSFNVTGNIQKPVIYQQVCPYDAAPFDPFYTG